MRNSRKKMESDGEASSPSAPPIAWAVEDTTEHPLKETKVEICNKRTSLSRDSNLVRDLLRKADGDTGKVASWLEVMGESVSPEELQTELGRCEEGNGNDVDAAASQLGAPETFFCPISFHLFRDPVLLQTGQTYERSVIQRWLAEGGSICPITGVELPKPVILTPNVALRQAIEDWAYRNAEWMLGPNGRLLPVPESERRHFSVRQQQTANDADRALAISLQEAELAQQQRVQRRRPYGRDSDMTRSQYDRVRRCVILLFIITVVYFVMFVHTLRKGDWKFEKIDSNPLIGFGARVLRQVGCTDTHLIADKNEWWRIVTSALMTAGIVHLQWVVCCLWTCGRFLATRMSFFSLGLLYVISAICGVLLSANISTTAETAGASGGSFGLIGAVIVETLIHRKHYKNHSVSILFLILTATVGILIGTTPFVDNWTNAGGLISGFCLALALRLTHRGLRHSNRVVEFFLVAIQVFWFLLVGVFLVAGVVSLVVREDVRNSNCSWCSHITCVDTDWWDCDAAVIPPDDAKCTFDIQGDLTTTITCPSGHNETVQLTDISQRNLDRYCDDICEQSDRESEQGSSRSPSRNSSGSVVVIVPPNNQDDDYSSSLEQGNVEQSKTE